MLIVKYRKIFFGITGAIVLASLISLFVYGLHLGTDFTGGTLVQMTYPGGRPAPAVLQESLNAGGFKGYSLREANANDYILRAGNLTDEERTNLPEILSVGGSNPVIINTLTEVGPTIGLELEIKRS